MNELSSVTIALITLGCCLSGLLLGLLLRMRLPEHHVRDDSKDILKAATGMIATLVALVIGLLVSSAKSALDTASSSITQSGAKIITLDRTLARYGPETQPIRDFQRKMTAAAVQRYFPKDGSNPSDISNLKDSTDMEELHAKIHALNPKDDPVKHDLQSQALQTCNELLQARWLLLEQAENPVPTAFLVILIFWLTVLFAGFGILAPWNITSILSLSVCAISMAGAMLLILEMNRPLEGLIKVSGGPLQKSLDVLGK